MAFPHAPYGLLFAHTVRYGLQQLASVNGHNECLAHTEGIERRKLGVESKRLCA